MLWIRTYKLWARNHTNTINTIQIRLIVKWKIDNYKIKNLKHIWKTNSESQTIKTKCETQHNTYIPNNIHKNNNKSTIDNYNLKIRKPNYEEPKNKIKINKPNLQEATYKNEKNIYRTSFSIYIYIYIHVRMCIHIYIYRCIHMSVCIYTDILIYTRICKHVYVYIYLYIHI